MLRATLAICLFLAGLGIAQAEQNTPDSYGPPPGAGETSQQTKAKPYTGQDDAQNREKAASAQTNKPSPTTNETKGFDYTSPDWWVAIFTFLLALIAAGQLIVFSKQANRLRETVDVMKRSEERQTRTWLRLRPTTIGPITFDGDKIRLSIEIIVENIGTSPAVAVNCDCIAHRGRGSIISKIQLQRLILGTKEWSNHGVTGIILIRGQKYHWRFSLDAEMNKELEANALAQERLGVPAANLEVTLSVACCVIYKSFASNEWCHTGEVIWLLKKDRTKFDATLGDIPPENIKAIMSPGQSELA